MSNPPRKSSCVTLLAALLGATPIAAHEIRVVALSGTQAPGEEPGRLFASFAEPMIDDRGRTAFDATLEAPGGPGTVWLELVEGTLLKQIEVGDPAPGLAGPVTSDTWLRGWWNGRATVEVGLEHGIGGVSVDNDVVIYNFNAAGGAVRVVRDGDEFPGDPEALVEDPFETTSTAAGVFLSFEASSSDSGLLRRPNGGVPEYLVLEGVTPAVQAGSVFSSAAQLAGNDLGEVYFFAGLAQNGGLDPPITSSNDTGLFVHDGATFAEVLREGDQIPNLPAGAVLANAAGAGPVVVNDAGEVAFTSFVRGTGVTAATDWALWGPDGAGGVRVVAREGIAAPGAPNTVFFNFLSFALAGEGTMAFVASLSGAGSAQGSVGLWRVPPGGAPALIARIGDAAPFGGGEIALDPYFEMNARGEILIWIWASTEPIFRLYLLRPGSSTPERILLRSDTMAVGPGDEREVTSFEFQGPPSGGQDGRPRAMNDDGEIALTVHFEGGSEAVVVLRAALFANGFEAGSFSGWSQVVGSDN